MMQNMLNIYKMELDFGMVTAQDLAGYITMGIISKADYDWIVGETYTPSAQPVQPVQPAQPQA